SHPGSRIRCERRAERKPRRLLMLGSVPHLARRRSGGVSRPLALALAWPAGTDGPGLNRRQQGWQKNSRERMFSCQAEVGPSVQALYLQWLVNDQLTGKAYRYTRTPLKMRVSIAVACAPSAERSVPAGSMAHGRHSRNHTTP